MLWTMPIEVLSRTPRQAIGVLTSMLKAMTALCKFLLQLLLILTDFTSWQNWYILFHQPILQITHAIMIGCRCLTGDGCFLSMLFSGKSPHSSIIQSSDSMLSGTGATVYVFNFENKYNTTFTTDEYQHQHPHADDTSCPAKHVRLQHPEPGQRRTQSQGGVGPT